MRRIADQRQPFGDESPRDLEAEGKASTREARRIAPSLAAKRGAIS